MTRASEWRLRVAGWKRSGLSAGEFAGKGAFSAQQLRNWASKLGMVSGRRAQTGAEVQIVPVVRSGRGAPRILASSRGGEVRREVPVVLKVGETTIEVREGASEAVLQMAVSVVRRAQGAMS